MSYAETIAARPILRRIIARAGTISAGLACSRAAHELVEQEGCTFPTAFAAAKDAYYQLVAWGDVRTQELRPDLCSIDPKKGSSWTPATNSPTASAAPSPTRR